ncbi:hypothetical protein LMH87_004772 [Akanthomyces muscarius]|uniref:Uncharacterized protein n=1 Tax=Akanthomyces muscarius TaxID=2231603 RepID=A0A9W8Q3X4_AKAMU|nr:hypothetical protein LMH87_004772 [Akanthomyces muscarius]KAJ4145941.1 hypothetical protein LMH87_004772 [Akanthomyces muscarius]
MSCPTVRWCGAISELRYALEGRIEAATQTQTNNPTCNSQTVTANQFHAPTLLPSRASLPKPTTHLYAPSLPPCE